VDKGGDGYPPWGGGRTRKSHKTTHPKTPNTKIHQKFPQTTKKKKKTAHNPTQEKKKGGGGGPLPLISAKTPRGGGGNSERRLPEAQETDASLGRAKKKIPGENRDQCAGHLYTKKNGKIRLCSELERLSSAKQREANSTNQLPMEG